MSSLLIYMVVLGLGFLLGNYLRKKNKKKFKYGSTIQLIMIYAIITFMGIRIGIRESIMHNMFTIGISSLLFTFIILVCATISSSIGRKILGFDKYGDRHKGKNFLFDKENSISEKIKDYKESKKKSFNFMTIGILMFAITGVVFGYIVVLSNIKSGRIFGGSIDVFESFASKMIMLTLCILLFLVGVDLGYDKKTIDNIKKAGLVIILFPIFNIIGTTIGCIIGAILFNMNIFDGLACGEGYAWFSIAPSILLNFGLIENGAIAFLHNVLREIMAFLFIPFVAKKIGYIECTCLGGAAAMDDCLPMIERSTTPVVAVYGFVSGVILTALVPIMTTFFATLAAG